MSLTLAIARVRVFKYLIYYIGHHEYSYVIKIKTVVRSLRLAANLLGVIVKKSRMSDTITIQAIKNNLQGFDRRLVARLCKVLQRKYSTEETGGKVGWSDVEALPIVWLLKLRKSDIVDERNAGKDTVDLFIKLQSKLSGKT